jgi:hypothetical protein
MCCKQKSRGIWNHIILHTVDTVLFIQLFTWQHTKCAQSCRPILVKCEIFHSAWVLQFSRVYRFYNSLLKQPTYCTLYRAPAHGSFIGEKPCIHETSRDNCHDQGRDKMDSSFIGQKPCIHETSRDSCHDQGRDKMDSCTCAVRLYHYAFTFSVYTAVVTENSVHHSLLLRFVGIIISNFQL